MPPADAFGALGDPHRRTICALLAGGPRSVQDLADALPISRPAVSRHLRLLKEARLVEDRSSGRRHLYRLRPEGVAEVQGYLQAVWGDAARRFTVAAENTTPRRRR